MTDTFAFQQLCERRATHDAAAESAAARGRDVAEGAPVATVTPALYRHCVRSACSAAEQRDVDAGKERAHSAAKRAALVQSRTAIDSHRSRAESRLAQHAASPASSAVGDADSSEDVRDGSESKVFQKPRLKRHPSAVSVRLDNTGGLHGLASFEPATTPPDWGGAAWSESPLAQLRLNGILDHHCDRDFASTRDHIDGTAATLR